MILLDTHIWVNWILSGDDALTPAVVQAMQEESRLAVSAISCFEVSLLVSRGRLELPLPVSEWLTEALANSGVESLPVTCEIAMSSGNASRNPSRPGRSDYYRNSISAWRETC